MRRRDVNTVNRRCCLYLEFSTYVSLGHAGVNHSFIKLHREGWFSHTHILPLSDIFCCAYCVGPRGPAHKPHWTLGAVAVGSQNWQHCGTGTRATWTFRGGGSCFLETNARVTLITDSSTGVADEDVWQLCRYGGHGGFRKGATRCSRWLGQRAAGRKSRETESRDICARCAWDDARPNQRARALSSTGPGIRLKVG